MKKLSFFLFAIFLTSISFDAFPRQLGVTMLQFFNYSSGEEFPEIGESSHRRPSRKLECDIDDVMGITFYGEEVGEIITYEIYNNLDFCIGLFYDESEFIEFLFLLTGEYRLVFSTEEYDLEGWVYI